jgi:hypothetical protein
VLIRPDAARLLLGAATSWTWVRAGHSVEPDQQEPGIPADAQAARHETDFVLGSLELGAALGLSARWTVELSLPLRLIDSTARFYDAADRQIPGFVSIHHRDEVLVGLGDVGASGRFRVVGADGGAVIVDLSAGVFLPTGNTEPDPFVKGAAGEAHQHMFFGNGTVDPQLGALAVWMAGAWRTSAYGSLRWPVAENGYGYRGPRLIAGGVAVDRSVGSPTWRVMAGVGGFVERPATWSGRASENSGRTSLIGRLALFYLPAPTWQWSLGVDMPKEISSVGGQLEMPVMVRLSLSHQMAAPWTEPSAP